jgi:hypothetical protein
MDACRPGFVSVEGDVLNIEIAQPEGLTPVVAQDEMAEQLTGPTAPAGASTGVTR